MKYVGLIASYLIGLFIMYLVAVISVGFIRGLAMVMLVVISVVYVLKLRKMLQQSIDPEGVNERGDGTP
jgi:Ca2+/Na+ antiporter